MEYLLGFIIIVILLLILGIGFDVIISGVLILLLIITAASELFFVYFGIRILFSRRFSGSFVRIDKPEKSRFDVAFYGTESGELPNVFPAEFVMRDKIYKPDKTVSLRLDAGKKYVYDRNARLTIGFGLLLCTLLTLALAVSLPLFVPVFG